MVVQRTLEGVKNIFLGFDADGNGYIDKSELKVCLKQMGANLSDDDVSQMFDESARIHPDRLQFKEFISALCIGSILKVRTVMFASAFVAGSAESIIWLLFLLLFIVPYSSCHC